MIMWESYPHLKQHSIDQKFLPPQWLHFKDLQLKKRGMVYTKVQRNLAIFYNYIASSSLNIIVIRLFDTHKMKMTR